MISHPNKPLNPKLRGMTLMEVVIAIGIVAFVVPIILAATAATNKSRRNAEADTRSAWLAKDVHREILSKWTEPVRESVITTDIGFPVFASEKAPLVLVFDSDGAFIAEGSVADIESPCLIPSATYLVTVFGEAYIPSELALANGIALSHVQIKVLHPAKSTPANRSELRYNLLTYRQGSL